MRMAVTVNMPTAMKMSVARNDRGLRRLIPHTPWPLVQPPPMRTPTPTKMPATAIAAIERPRVATTISGKNKASTTPVPSKPSKKNPCHDDLLRLSIDAVIPLTPVV